jgi:hypothetical protein
MCNCFHVPKTKIRTVLLPGPCGSPGVTGTPGLTGLTGLSGPTGLTGAPNESGELLQVNRFDSDSITTQYDTPADAKSLRVQLWGAGGGGGGAQTQGSAPNNFAVGGGGGGGGYCEAFITSPSSTYTFQLTAGGAGGVGGAGVAGGQSWFSSNTDIVSEGGAGGQSVTSTISLLNNIQAPGGVGGLGHGTLVAFGTLGSAGESGWGILQNNARNGMLYSGAGGGSGFKCGGSAGKAVGRNAWPASLAGENGGTAGGGGSGALVAQQTNISVNGGNGSGAVLVVEAYS